MQTPSSVSETQSCRQRFEEALEVCYLSELWQPGAQDLFKCSEAHLYPLKAGGKRVRPVLCLLMSRALGQGSAVLRAIPSALALEFVHTYSLVHDDLPCMDNDALRRGLPTTHVVYGDAKALLVGDGLLTAAFQILSSPELLGSEYCGQTDFEMVSASRILSRAAGPRGMVKGQWLDMSLEKLGNKDLEDAENLLCQIHHLKTGALLQASLEMGFVHGLGSTLNSAILSVARPLFERIGFVLGLYFQIQDDLLDQEVSSAQLGKTAGKDMDSDKLTAIKLWGVGGARERMEAFGWELKSLLQQIFSCGIQHVNFVSKSTMSESDEDFQALLQYLNSLSNRTH